MALNCNGIENVSISNNYEGELYDLKVDVNFNSSTVFQASFISKNRQYNIQKETLDSESPSILNINGRTFNVYPVAWKIQENPSSSTLAVRYIDASHKYLDKFNVILKGIKNSRFISVVPSDFDEVSNQEQDLQIGNYTPKELVSLMKGKIPMSTRAFNLLNSLSFERDGFFIFGIYINTMGSLRNVINAISSQIGVLFYWDWSVGGEGRLDYYDWSSVSGTENFASQIKNQYNEYVSSFERSYSIEDNETYGEFVYNTSSVENIPTRKNATLYPLRVNRSNFWKKPNGDYIPKSILERSEWLQMCAIAMVSETLFKKYVYYNLAAKSTESLASLYFRSSEVEDVSSLSSSVGAIESYNQTLVSMFSNYEVGLIFYHDSSKTVDQMTQFLNNNKAQTRSEILLEMTRSSNDDPLIKKFKKKGGYWCFAMKAVKSIDGDSDGTSESAVNNLYNTCKTFGESLNRYYITNGSTWTRKEHRDFSISEEFVFQNSELSNTPLNSLSSYLNQNGESIQISFDNFISRFKNNQSVITSGGIISGDSEDDENSAGYLLLDNGSVIGSKKVSVKDTIELAFLNYDTNTPNYTLAKMKYDGYEAIVITRDSSIIDDARVASNFIFGYQENKGYIRKRYSKPNDGFTNSLNYKTYVPNQKNKWAVSNSMAITKVPDTINSSVFDQSVPIQFDLQKWIDTISVYKNQPTEPNSNFSMSVEKLVIPSSDWILKGLESYSISYGGENGVTTSISFGSRKKKRQSLDNDERLLGVYMNGVNMTKAYSPSPSTKSNILYNQRAWT